ncbi:MAG: carbonic anhydrase [Candidatus Electronema aureum]|uniref:Carbonic anhydrase n=1 Tax=Candidatus Electronema aureum TaxID=2005002 RepID=A0A521G2U8_9BACT|nr:MAG: carbonic anhydrase [Candidatus Electronema aureum]
MKRGVIKTVLGACLLALAATPAFATDLTADQALTKLKEGNERFVSGKSMHPHTDAARLIQAGKEDQGNHAYATIISCSDSRVPVERIFDAGIMDTFIIRVAGNVIDTDEAGSIEYGLAHVNTPVFLVLGHTQCGAVKAVTAAVTGHGHALEINIPPLVDNIEPAVKRAMELNPKAKEDKDIVPAAIVENVWQGVQDLFTRSAAVREMAKGGKVKVVGAIYDVSTGKVEWLPEDKVGTILADVEKDPKRQMQAMADEGKGHEDHGDKKEEHKEEGKKEEKHN